MTCRMSAWSKQIASVAEPETILAGYRRLVPQKFDGSKPRNWPRRPSTDKMRILIQHGANVNARSLTGYTALAAASHYGHADDAITLLRQNSNNLSAKKASPDCHRHTVPRLTGRRTDGRYARTVSLDRSVSHPGELFMARWKRESCQTTNRDEAPAYLHRRQGKLASGESLTPDRVSVRDLLRLVLED